MDYLLKKFCPRTDFDNYEDFAANFAIEVPAGFNFAYDVVDAWAAHDPTKRALVWCDDKGRECVQTFADIARLSDVVAAAFVARLGIAKGDVVLLMLRQRWEYWTIAVACMKIGAILVPGSVQMTAKDIAYRADSAGFATVIALDDEYVRAQVEGAFQLTGTLQQRVLVSADELPEDFTRPSADSRDTFRRNAPVGVRSSGNEGRTPIDLSGRKASLPNSGEGHPGLRAGVSGGQWLSFMDVLTPYLDATWTRPTGQAATVSDDTLMLYFTSGTTGNPKMVRHNHIHPLGHIVTARYWQQVQEDTLHLTVTDSGWAKFGWGKIYGQWICGATIFAWDMDKFIPARLLQLAQDWAVTTFCVPPTMYRFMLQEDVGAYDLSSVKTFATAGEPLNAEVSLQWEQLTGKKIREGFGQSEGSVLIATWSWLEPKPGVLGRPAPLYGIRLIADANTATEHEAEDGEEGAICVTGLRSGFPPGLFVGYYRDPERTAEAFGEDGGDRYNLGDMAWRDVDGSITFVGRNDDVIKASGYRIGPFEVESALVAHPAVVEAAVTGAPDAVRGTVVKADVVLAAGYEPSDELVRELQAWVKQTTAPYKYPRIVAFVDELPKTIGGKIKRAEIRAANERAL
ncbi:MAG: AMP-binding protein [Actinomycetes bacterium]|jgi:acetyl-CoA synthetase|nr:AMP-binding protein [Actinomycetes bacterium]